MKTALEYEIELKKSDPTIDPSWHLVLTPELKHWAKWVDSEGRFKKWQKEPGKKSYKDKCVILISTADTHISHIPYYQSVKGYYIKNNAITEKQFNAVVDILKRYNVPLDFLM